MSQDDSQDRSVDASQEGQDSRFNDENALPSQYDATEIEKRWYKKWEDAGVFHADVKATTECGKKPYVLMMPPPNVTGTLHNGHALFVTLQDILIRYHRMLGENALWLPGVDHAGIATQGVVERELKKHEGKSRRDLGRDEFLKRVWDWKEKSGARIVEQMKVLGASADWERERFTMDDQCTKAVNEAFVKMWNDDLIYRGERLVNWDPLTQTALSNEEVNHDEKKGEMWSFAYKIKGENGEATDDEIVVATTRPETMLGDTAVAVHPDDERYAHLVGKELVHPFFADRKITIVADDYVDEDKGTGAVKITPAHDPNDFEMGQRHNLEMLNILNLDGSINLHGGKYAGLDRYDAREKIKADLEKLEFFRGTEKIKHQVSVSERSGAAIEPMLSRQYFVKAKGLAEKAMDAVKSGETRIMPESWNSTWDHFMTNIRDWCVSRQLWWGHRIPVFYDLTKIDEAIETDANRKGGMTDASKAQADGNAGKELLAIALTTLDDDLVRYFSKASTEDLVAQDPKRWTQEEDVLDTWFSSGLWPFSTLGWPEKTEELDAFYPGAVLETGSDILFFWVARMMMMGTYFMGEAPFKDVYLHSMVRDASGKKMSKSEGNAIDPLDVINGITLEDLVAKTKTYPVPEKKLPKVLKGLEQAYPEGIPASGADGLRFSLAALSSQGGDVKLAIPVVAGYRKLLNKIWNATRFGLMMAGDDEIQPLSDVVKDLSVADKWILSRLQVATQKVTKSLDTYRFNDAANVIYQFFWTEFCDWYIEISKTSLYSEGGSEKAACLSVFLHVLDASMRLMHPICPFQSEEIWQLLPGRDGRWPGVEFCAVAPFPVHDEKLVFEAEEKDLQLIQDAVGMARNLRQESDLGAKRKVDVWLLTDDKHDRKVLHEMLGVLTKLGSLGAISVLPLTGTEIPTFASVTANACVEVVLPLEGLIDLEVEKKRLQKELTSVEKEHGRLGKQLGNENFVKRAKPEVVVEAKKDLVNLEARLVRVKASLERISKA
ncbi:MAG: valine--tRNA ligase [Deltaproteobacteria bacterium]|nr:valine--tRNA ligase [Deltaproteobacteria bacterium]